MTELSKDDIIEYLALINVELESLDMQGEIILAGGAAMLLIHETRDLTKDIDALYEPKSIISQIARKIALEYNLQPNWLNDGVKAFVAQNAPINGFLHFSALKVYSLSPEYLLAMKLLASRSESKDIDDIRFLFKHLGIKTEEKATEILLTYFDENQILPKTQYIVRNILDETTMEPNNDIADPVERETTPPKP